MYLTPGFCDGSRNFFELFAVPAKFLFYSDKTESIEWQDLVPRQRIDDCLEIHFPH